MAVSEYDKKHLSAADQAEIERVTKAATEGTMSWDDAHKAAESIRSNAGYSGGADGSGYTATNTSSNKNTTTTKPSNFTGSATGVTTYTNDQSSIIDQMNKNSDAWWDAPDGDENTPGTKQWLHKQNQDLAAQLGGNVASSFNSVTGTWGGSAAKPQQVQTYDNSKSSQIDALLNAILNREEFSYDYTTDPSYLAYEQQYKRLGDRAREDTLGDIASLTGGYASSWAASAASQAQNDYNQQLSGIIPTLYDAAYNRYMDDYNMDVSNLGLLMGIDQRDYDRYRDTVSDSQWQQSFDKSNEQWDKDYELSKEQLGLSKDQFEWNKIVDDFNMKAQEQTTKFNQMMDRWNTTGVADSEVAAYLGIPVGATTESYYFNKASLALDQAKFDQSKKENEKANAENDYLSESIARNAQSLINNTESYQEGAKYILSAVSSADEFFSVGSRAGIPNSILQEVFDSYYDEALRTPDEEMPSANRDKTYWKNAAFSNADPASFLSNNMDQIMADGIDYASLLKEVLDLEAIAN